MKSSVQATDSIELAKIKMEDGKDGKKLGTGENGAKILTLVIR